MNKKLKINIVSISLSLFATLIITSILLLLIGKNPLYVFSLIISEVFGSGYGLGQALFKSTPLIFCSIGIALCFHASLFNIGAEGQLNAGAFVLALTVYYTYSSFSLFAIPFGILMGFIASGIVGFIPAILKIKKGISEVITTIMLNFIIFALINYLLIQFFSVKSTVNTNKIPDSIMIPKISVFFDYFNGSALNLSFIIAIIFAVIMYFVIYKTTIGYKIRAIGFNEQASKYMRIKVNKYSLLTFSIGAGITSLVGLNYVLGYKGYYEFGFSNNLGFTSIAVALLAKNNPIGIIFSSLLFGILDYGGLSINTQVPKEIMLVVQAIVIISIISINKITENFFLKNNK